MFARLTFPLASGTRNRAPEHLDRIDAPGQWHTLSARPGHHTVARTETVKFVIDREDDNRTYFINSRKWVTHYQFVLRFINPRADYRLFLIAEYKRDDRRFILGSVMHYFDGDHWAVELDSCDTLGADQIAWMFHHVAARLGVARNLRFRPLSPGQISNAESLGSRLPVLSRDAINATIEYQPVVLGVAYGYLRIFRDKFDVASVRPYDIVVTDGVPEEIPPVAALVTGALQAPLAHVAVLSRNRNTPDMAIRSATTLATFLANEGELVRLSVASQDFHAERVERAEAEAAWAAIRPAVPFRPEVDPAPVGLLDVNSLAPGAIRHVGAKAAQVGELCRIEGVATPGGFAVPFSAYLAHLESAGISAEIDAMLDAPDFQGDAAIRADRLARLRAAIAAHPVDPVLLETIRRKLRSLAISGRLIFRSSTNAEDLPGFNGAGLYESIIVPPDPSLAQIADKLRSVWASVWLQRAFEEREWYRIDHRTVAMAVLVQPFVEDAVATGVAITGNPFKPDLSAVFINTQTISSTVTGAAGNELPEQYLVATWGSDYELDLLSRSSLTNGEIILHESDVRRLTEILLGIHRAMLPAHAPRANAMDVEFALTGDRRFIVLQARPYTIAYPLDRAPRPQRREKISARVMRKARRLLHPALSAFKRYRARPPRVRT